MLIYYKRCRIKDLVKEEADAISAKVSLTLQNSNHPKYNLFKDERKIWKELQSDTSIVILPAEKGRSTVILNREDYLQKCIYHINNAPNQLLEKHPTIKIKTKTLKKWKPLKDNEFIDSKLYYYLKPTDWLRLYFMVHQKYTSQECLYLLLFHIVAPSCTILTNAKDEYRNAKNFTTSEMFPLKMMR